MKKKIIEYKTMFVQLKVALPWDMFIVGILFSLFLPLICSVSTYNEIGGVIDPNFAFLAIIIFSNTYYIEIQQKTSEVFYLVPNHNKMLAVNKRILIKVVFMILLFMLSFLLFNFYRPHIISESYQTLFIKAFFAVTSSVFFWGSLSYSLVNAMRNLWVGIGISIVGWVFMNSTFGRALPIVINIFAYGNTNDLGIQIPNWEIGKILEIIIGFMLLFVNKFIIGKSPCKYKR